MNLIWGRKYFLKELKARGLDEDIGTGREPAPQVFQDNEPFAER
jgi:hypothetical protein